MSEEKRYTPSISLKEDERDWIKKQAEKAGISYTNYMRKVVLGELPPADVPFDKKDSEINFKNGITHREMEKVLYKEMPNWGNNLNQIARRLNEGNPADDKMIELMEAIDEKADKMVTVIFKALR